jgi:transposase
MGCIDHTAANQTATRADDAAILVSVELSISTWLVTALVPGVDKMSKYAMAAGGWQKLLNLFERLQAKAERQRGGRPEIICIQEAGLDGFWLHRRLENHGIRSHVVDAGSIPVPRRKRRAKTDRIDGETLIRALAAWLRGETKACSMVVPPTSDDEDRRRLVRERGILVSERTAESNRIRGLLQAQGIYGFNPQLKRSRAELMQLQTGDGRPLPVCLTAELNRAFDRLQLIQRQIAGVEAARDALLDEAAATQNSVPSLLLPLVSIGPSVCGVLWLEGLFRSFANRRKVASYAGLAATPWRSGSIDHEQGISKAGNPRLRRMLVQLSWLWLKHQRHSALSRWYHQRVGAKPSRRTKRVFIVALARKLLVALWRYVTQGVVPEGAVLKTV